MNGKFPLDLTAIYELQQRIAEYEDEVAYKKLFFHFFLPLKSFSFSIVKSKENAEEIVSDIFLDIWIKRKQLSTIEGLKMYLYTAVRNNSLRKLQQNKKATFFCLDEVQVEFASPDENAEAILLTHELSHKIDLAINQLPQRCKLIFKLAKEDKLKYKEIAALLNVSIKTIDSHVATALKKIATVLNISLKKSSSN
ncbi:MAG: RNA polymerase sigma-70 factor [Ferruginibacter sp.]|nr:RNA polymerase sigma-70 factor [Ferruginibacter sp.]